jgi:hypothetical protein
VPKGKAIDSAKALSLADAEYFGTAGGAAALGSRPLVLKRGCLGILHFYFLPAFHTISLHGVPPFISLPRSVANVKLFVNTCRHKNGVIFMTYLTLRENKARTMLQMRVTHCS